MQFLPKENNVNEMVPTSPGASISRSDGVEMEIRSDLNAAAVSAREEATVKARCALARSQPRDIDVVRSRLLKECKRPGFALVAMYALPRAGKVIEGLSIRAAEAVGRQMGNLWVNAQIVNETSMHRTIEVFAMDLESNFTESQQVVISRTVERKADRDGGPPKNAGPVLSERLNSYGEKVFVCFCTDDEMLVKTNSAAARIRRNKILEMCPGDILEEVKAAVKATLKASGAADPEGTRKALLDAFDKYMVSPAELKSYAQAKWGVPLERLQPEHLAALRLVVAALKDGNATWDEFMRDAAGEKAVDKKTGEVVTAPQLNQNTVQTLTPPGEPVKSTVIDQPVPTEAPRASPPRQVEQPASFAQGPQGQAVGEGIPPVNTPAYTAWLHREIERAAAAPKEQRDARFKAIASKLIGAPKEEQQGITEFYMQARKESR